MFFFTTKPDGVYPVH